MEDKGNLLFPVFFRLEKLQLLIVGGGNVALEKVSFLFKNSENANVTLVAPEIKPEIEQLSHQYPMNLSLVKREFMDADLEGKDLVIAATSIKELNSVIWENARKRKILINVADTPELCDFYLSSVVKKGDLKIAISTNGKSPTFAKRMRELLEESLPDSIGSVLNNLNEIRQKLKGDLEYKMKKMGEITSVMKEKNPKE